MLKRLIEKIESAPKYLFLLDGIGALLSAFLLGVVLVRFENIFGIPPSTLYFLAAVPIFFAMYDLICFPKADKKTGRLLKGIAIMNLLYCGLSIGAALYHIYIITSLGWAYIIVEVLIIISLAIVEIRNANKTQANK